MNTLARRASEGDDSILIVVRVLPRETLPRWRVGLVC